MVVMFHVPRPPFTRETQHVLLLYLLRSQVQGAGLARMHLCVRAAWGVRVASRVPAQGLQFATVGAVPCDS